jgi:cell division protein FtsI/penicillin-binding protein 2
MVRIAQKLTQNTFYNYVEKLGFASMTNIELAGEDP